MPCSKDPEAGSKLINYNLPINLQYVFFDNIIEYVGKAESAENVPNSDEGYSGCESFSHMWKSKLKTKDNAKSICKQFIKLYNSLSHIKSRSIDNTDYKKDRSFLNYWVNMIINENRPYNNTCVNYFSDEMENHCHDIFYTVNILSNLLYDIKGGDFKKINILYNLYVNYDKIKSNIDSLSENNKTSLLPHSDKCYDMYKIAETMNNAKDPVFYEKLKDFTSLYEQLYPTFEQKEKQFNIYFKRLSDVPNNIITTSVLGSFVVLIPFMGILYKVKELCMRL
ncbi:hypothetical protein PVNG_04719 [Plasmodium vivax North Korean]|uniref:Uncharacterized protein n=1 Tax=Plasmodium vivax North Korean TaxID=1035514 RepID=A0A0J9U3E7_PLAVI|nr:hypothetical protein PVNG_04719 [Plasmodium vivax North Korean]